MSYRKIRSQKKQILRFLPVPRGANLEFVMACMTVEPQHEEFGEPRQPPKKCAGGRNGILLQYCHSMAVARRSQVWFHGRTRQPSGLTHCNLVAFLSDEIFHFVKGHTTYWDLL